MLGGGWFAPNSKKYKGAPIVYVADYETDGSVVAGGDGTNEVIAFSPEIRAIALSPDTEIAVDITGASRVEFRCRTENEIHYGYESGATQGNNYRTLKVDDEKYLDFGMGQYLGSLYFSCSVAVEIELEVWKNEALLIPTEPEPTPTIVKLSGSIFGTEGFFQDKPQNSYTSVFDGNVNTFFDSNTADGAIAGMAFGQPRTLTRIRFHPRIGETARSIGGRFQIRLVDGSVQLVYTIPSLVIEGWNDVSIPAMQCVEAWYVSPTQGFGNIAEIEFYGF